MPQLHHRDPSIIGLLGASPHLTPLLSAVNPPLLTRGISGRALNKAISSLKSGTASNVGAPYQSEAFDELDTPPLTPLMPKGVGSPPQTASRGEMHFDKGQVADMAFERPFYGMIVDGIHSHPNSVRVGSNYFI